MDEFTQKVYSKNRKSSQKILLYGLSGSLLVHGVVLTALSLGSIASNREIDRSEPIEIVVLDRSSSPPSPQLDAPSATPSNPSQSSASVESSSSTTFAAPQTRTQASETSQERAIAPTRRPSDSNRSTPASEPASQSGFPLGTNNNNATRPTTEGETTPGETTPGETTQGETSEGNSSNTPVSTGSPSNDSTSRSGGGAPTDSSASGGGEASDSEGGNSPESGEIGENRTEQAITTPPEPEGEATPPPPAPSSDGEDNSGIACVGGCQGSYEDESQESIERDALIRARRNDRGEYDYEIIQSSGNEAADRAALETAREANYQTDLEEFNIRANIADEGSREATPPPPPPQPTYEEPTYEEPTYEEPTYEEPT
ncbi:hypothetical protein, partial [Baaleninema sp.]|uniref:hypothetical protein n=1 Tax=Baaleninema sp. TaxID=3101197 RepID=UPI003CFC513C